jgi:hypothetical protein
MSGMSWELVLAHIALMASIATVAAFGAWRCWRLLRYARDPRLLKLMWFYGLFAASLVPMAIWAGQSGEGIDDAFSALHSGAEVVNVLLLGHHALLLASLGIAVLAFSHKRGESAAVAVAGLVFFDSFMLVLLALEAILTLYLAVRAIQNYMERRSPPALQVAVGFLLFFIGHLSFFLFHLPGGAGILLGNMFALVGIVLLVKLLPRPTA